MQSIFKTVLLRDLRLAWRRRTDVLGSLFFFSIVASLFPLGMNPEMATLRQIGPGVVWVAALLACMLSLQRLFAADHADGTLEQLMLLPEALTLVVLAKACAHWLSSGLALVILTPVLAAQYGLDAQALAVLATALLLGTPVLSLIGTVGGHHKLLDAHFDTARFGQPGSALGLPGRTCQSARWNKAGCIGGEISPDVLFRPGAGPRTHGLAGVFWRCRLGRCWRRRIGRCRRDGRPGLGHGR